MSASLSPDFVELLPAPLPPRRPKFVIEAFDAIAFVGRDEWMVKRLIPRHGVGCIFGASQSFKSFAALSLAMHVAVGRDWAGRRVTRAPTLYIAAEGAAGLRKRKVGFERVHTDLPAVVPFYMIASAPNLGTERGDLDRLIAAVEAANVNPGLIVVDTLAQSLGAGDENGAGMVRFVANATALANHFRAFVLIVHHVGLSDDKRLRGHSSLIGALDAAILCERKQGELSTTLTLQKLKDDESNIAFTAHLTKVVVARDEDGDDVSTLVVDRIEEGAGAETKASPRSIPRGQSLLLDVTRVAIDEAGVSVHPFGDSNPAVRAVAESAVRIRHRARIAEQAEAGADRGKLSDRQAKAFKRSLQAALEADLLRAWVCNGQRFLWFP
ncbi:MAG: AAA family ATPase [Roseiarcus sp.]